MTKITKKNRAGRHEDTTSGRRAVLVGGLGMSGPDVGFWQGICRYAHISGNWLICDAGNDWSGMERTMSEEPIRGILAGVLTSADDQRIRATGLPVVGVSVTPRDKHDSACVGLDNHRVGALVADYFADRRFENFAVVPAPDNPAFSCDRIAGFCGALARRNFDVYEMDADGRTGRLRTKSKDGQYGPAKPFYELPRPLAVFTVEDVAGRAFCRACARKGLRIPEDVAVMGAGDFEIVCETAFPPLSSVRIPVKQIGYSAARMLDHLIRGKPPAESTILLPPVDVHTRQSSDVIAVEDQTLAKALAFIRSSSEQRISSEDVIKHCKVHRRLLERRFRTLMKRTILSEIQRVRTDRAISLLMDSNEPLHTVAINCGFRNQDHMGKVFRVFVGKHPRDFRRAFQIR